MRIGISALNVQSERDYWRLNNLITSLEESQSGGSFLLLARTGQEDFIVQAPECFQYRFIKINTVRRGSGLQFEEKLLHDSLEDFHCDVLFEFGSSDPGTLDIPRVSLVSSGMTGPVRGDKSSSRYKLKLIARSASKMPDKSEDIIFPSRFTMGFLPLSSPEFYRNGDSDIPKKQDNIISEDGELLSRYRIDGRFFFCVVYPDSIPEMKNLLKAYRNACATNPDIPRLVFASAGKSPEDIAAIMDIMKNIELDSKIIFIGALHENDLPELFSETLAFIYPHENENSPEILLAAMAGGCAILSSNKGDIPEIAGSAALYFDSGNSEDLAFKMNLISNDNDLVDFLKRESQKAGSRFTWQNVAGRLVGFFADVINDRDVSRMPEPISAEISSKT